ncbi:GNAT family N-acetyltransferase [Psychrobacillus glaciei]|uniref:Lipid II:glycine glycyltransferase n=1 Tax=Psychrobacillus glaciei TaxID=2283160 RepID=A0A5J6STB4_9BACI|nr:GNAT family N-acetyltransferase [Psychrobacillus glaciei]
MNVITINESEKWDEIVKSFEIYDVNYLSGYAKAFQLNGEGDPLLFCYDDGITRAINVVMKRDIAKSEKFEKKLPLNTWYDLSTPYGYGGFLINGDDYEKVNNAFNLYCKNSGYVSEFVRFHLFNDYSSYYDGTIESHTQNIVRDLGLPLEEMIMDFEHKVRKSLKKALREELEVEIDSTGERLEEFLDIYYQTMESNNANESFYFPKKFFETINNMKENFIYIHILHEGKIISTELVLYGPENCYSFLGGTNREYLKLQPNTLLKYEIIKWAKTKGLKRFILGGGYGNNDGIFKYKKSFAPNGIYDFYIGKKIIDETKYYNLLSRRKSELLDENNITFYPKYRG